ncbi:MAG: formiminotransferase-cyclodeaminase, partial [Microbacteriaceae bacterium]|nr:formiminotransferase-cyclodeaminase [Microbacteriaceae bacterium]
AAAGVMLAIALGLTSMVAGYTAEPESDEDLAALRKRARSRLDTALRLADDDASASEAFGNAFALEPGDGRDDAVNMASLEAARTSAAIGDSAAEAIGDLEWLSEHGNPAVISDTAVALGALRAALIGARTNVSFDLAALRSAGEPLDQIRERHPALWVSVQRFSSAIARIDSLATAIDDRAAPTD